MAHTDFHVCYPHSVPEKVAGAVVVLEDLKAVMIFAQCADKRKDLRQFNRLEGNGGKACAVVHGKELTGSLVYVELDGN